MLKKPTRAQSKMIERARGRARQLAKKGLYSEALEQLKLRAEQAGISNIFSQSKMTSEERLKQTSLIKQFLRSKSSTVKGSQKLRQDSLEAVARSRGYVIPNKKSEKKDFLEKFQRNLKRESGSVNIADTVTELWNILKYDLVDLNYRKASEEVREGDISGADVEFLIKSVEDEGGLPVDQAPLIIERLQNELKSNPTFKDLWDILHPTNLESE